MNPLSRFFYSPSFLSCERTPNFVNFENRFSHKTLIIYIKISQLVKQILINVNSFLWPSRDDNVMGYSHAFKYHLTSQIDIQDSVWYL